MLYQQRPRISRKMTDRKEDEVKLSEEEFDRLLIETLEADSSPGYMNTNEQENVDELVKLSESEEIERMKKEKEEQEEIERIKKETEEREELDRLLKEMIKKELAEIELPVIETAHNSFPAYNIKKEPEEFDLPSIEMANSSFPVYNIKQEPVEYPDYNIKQEPVEYPDYDIKQEPVEFDLPLNDWEKLQNSTIKQEEQSDQRSKKIPRRKRSATAIPDLNPRELDPLQIAVEIAIKYHDFVDSTIDALIEERGNAEMEARKWNRILSGGIRLVESVNPIMERLPREMERMAKDANLQKEHAFRMLHLEEILKQIRDLNAEIEGSVDISLVSDMRYTEKVLPSCLKLLRSSKEELSELIEVIEGLKAINKDDEEDEYDEYDGDILLSESEES